MNWLLDTNTCIYFLNKRSDSIIGKLRELSPSQVKLPSITVAELFYGAEKSKRKKVNRVKVERFVSAFQIVPFDARAAMAYGKIRTALESSGTPIGPMDLLIASIGLAGGFVLVTNNEKEFKRVKGLRLEDWS